MKKIMQTSDLGNLLSMYSEWHSHLIPYYSFNNFVHKVEQVGASKRVKVNLFFFAICCIYKQRNRLLLPGIYAVHNIILSFYLLS